MNLLEAYKNRLGVSESYYGQMHGGEKMSNRKKLVVAKCLSNVDKYLKESFENSIGTQRADMGLFKKFSLNLTTVAVPNLIANDIVIVQPMSSMSGYISYLKFTTGSNKGKTAQGGFYNDVFRLGDVDVNYTSSQVASDMTVDAGTKSIELKWNPVVPGTIRFTNAGSTYYDDGNGKIVKDPTNVTRRAVMTEVGEDGRLSGVPGHVEVVFEGGSEAGTVIYDKAAGTVGITLTTGIEGAVALTYTYNNVVVPQNDLPILNAEMDAIPLIAKARRIAIYYSQISAFQAKTDYGFDLGSQLADQAVGRLMYEIDTEVTNLLSDNAVTDSRLSWSKTPGVGVNMRDHYESFLEKITSGAQFIYDKTKRYFPNYMLVASNLIPVLSFVSTWKPAPTSNINGPYFAGTVNGLRVYVTPNIKPGRYVIGVNGDDLMTSAAVYAPYMPVVPTQALGFADGGMSQGFSTVYDLKLLNKDLLIAGEVTD